MTQAFPSRFNCFAALFVFGILMLVSSKSSNAQDQQTLQVSFSRNANQPINIDLLVGQSRAIELDEESDASSTSIPGIVTVLPLTPKLLVVNGTAFGQVNLFVLKKRTSATDPQQILVFNVFVQKNITLLDNSIKILYPKENIQLSQMNDSVVISGSVTNPDIYADIEKILKGMPDLKVINLLKKPAKSRQQVEMQIRVAEVNRGVVRDVGTAFGILNSKQLPVYVSPGGPGSINVTGGLGTNNSVVNSISNVALSGGGSLTNLFLGRADLTSAFITALQQRNAIKTLSDTKIITLDGEEGKFLSGGKIPIPQVTSASNGQSGFSVTYQDYGVKLLFTPTIIDEAHIQIKVDTEVSDITTVGAIVTNGITIPALSVNNAKTVLELADGQSFALAGLLNNTEKIRVSQVPGISNIPVIGELFKSKHFERNESELMFLCTVKITEPLNPDQIPRVPGAPPNSLPAQPNAKSNDSSSGLSGTSLLPTSNKSQQNPTVGLLEGDSGHSVPRKPVPAKAALKTDQ